MPNTMDNSARIDLHTHSTASDGQFTPRELVALAQERQLTTIALTDHDSLGGIPEALATGRELGVEVIPGVELSLAGGRFTGVHLLGYYLDWEYPALCRTLEELRQIRAQRGGKMLVAVNRMLAEEGKAPLQLEDLRRIAQGALGRPHISRLLIRQGYAKDQDDAFARYLAPCNIPKKRISPQDGIALVRDAGGIPVLAHPHIMTDGRRTENRKDHLDFILQLISWGIEGIEVYYTGYTPEQIDLYGNLARSKGLLVTAGSDCHGEWPVPLGVLHRTFSLPSDIVPAMEERYQKLYHHPPKSKSVF